MGFTLRSNQVKMVGEARVSLREHAAVLLQAPTGFGKTAVGADILGKAVKKKRHALFIVHRQELIDQSVDVFNMEGIPHGIIAAGHTMQLFQPVQICSIDTLKRRVDKIKYPDLIVWDECHHMAAAGWAGVFNYFNKAKHIGLSATPQRLDGKGLGKYFGKMILGPTIRELIDDGWLVDYKAFAPTTPDMSGVASARGDYVQLEVVNAMAKSVITGDAVKHYYSYARGLRFLLFAPSIEYSENMANEFRATGTMAVHVDGETDKYSRKKAMQGFRDNNITGLTNVGLFGEGVDVPAAHVLIDMAPTQSLTAVSQRWGRVLRPVYAPGFDLTTRHGRLAAITASPKPYAIILDHAGNIMRHGLPCEERDWDLADRKKKKKSDEEPEFRVRQCPDCFFLHKPAPQCPKCGYVYEVNSRVIEHVDGELEELNKEKMRLRQNKRLAKAKTYEELLTEGIMRGYDQKKAEWFANKMLAQRTEWAAKIKEDRWQSRRQTL